LPNGKYLDILLRCLQLLTLCSVSFQAWAILYEHISHLAKEVKFVQKNFSRTFGKTNIFAKMYAKKFRENLPTSHALQMLWEKTFVSNVDDKFCLFSKKLKEK
jgi:hypothetical protein